MRIALIADAYVPARTSVAVQMRDLAMELRGQGHEPTLIVPSDSLSESWSVETLDDIEVLRLKAFRTKDVGLVRRACAEFLLPFAMLRWLSKSPYANTNWGGVVWYSPTIFFGPLVKSLKRRSQCRSYLILRDLFPDWAVDVGVLREGVAYRLLKLVERYQYSVADVIGVQTPSNLPYLAQWEDIPGKRVEVLNNWLSPKGSTADTSFDDLSVLDGKTAFVYAGNMGAAQGMDCLLELAASEKDKKDVAFLFIGRGSDVPRLKQVVMDKSLNNVCFHDEVDPSALPAVLARCHIGLLSLDPRHKTHNIPGKFLTYMHAGLPVLARVNAGNDLVNVIESNQIGYVCVGESSNDLADMADKLIASPTDRQDMGQRARIVGRENYSSVAAAKQILSALR